jgi:RNA recognition motif-containing protein
LQDKRYILRRYDIMAITDTYQTKSIKIIKDRDEKPKGFGYVEFEELDGLKDALAKSGVVSECLSYFRRKMTHGHPESLQPDRPGQCC